MQFSDTRKPILLAFQQRKKIGIDFGKSILRRPLVMRSSVLRVLDQILPENGKETKGKRKVCRATLTCLIYSHFANAFQVSRRDASFNPVVREYIITHGMSLLKLHDHTEYQSMRLSCTRWYMLKASKLIQRKPKRFSSKIIQ